VSEISIKGRFCAVCGKKEGPFRDNLCEKCYMKEHPLAFNVIKELEVRICPICGSIKVLGAHVSTLGREEGLEEILRELVRRTILEKINTDLTYDFEFEDDIDDSKILNYGVKMFSITTRIISKPYEEFSFFEQKFKTKIKLIRESCDDCSKYKSGYFEAILQVRGEHRKLTEVELKLIEQLISQTMKKHEDARIAYLLNLDIDEDGVTAKVSTKLLAESLAREIKGQTAGKLFVSYELKTRAKDGTDVYTNTYLVKLPLFAVGDIISYENSFWVVRSVSYQQIKVESLENHEIKKIDRKRIENRGRKKTDEIVYREFMLVSSSNKIAVIMGMDNYENFEDNSERVPPKKMEGEIIKGFTYDGKNYYIE